MSDNKYKLKDWQDLPKGGVIPEGGNAADYETGTWRTKRPVWKEENCIHCMTCWTFCPEEAYKLRDGETKSGKPRKEIKEVDYYHCKGCGLCAKECPINKKGDKTAIDMHHEET